VTVSPGSISSTGTRSGPKDQTTSSRVILCDATYVGETAGGVVGGATVSSST